MCVCVCESLCVSFLCVCESLYMSSSICMRAVFYVAGCKDGKVGVGVMWGYVVTYSNKDAYIYI